MDRQGALQEMYLESYTRMQKQIDDFYLRYANSEGLSIGEARKRANEMDVKAFNDRAAKAVKNKDFSNDTNEFLKLYNLKMKVSRLELLKANLQLEIQNLHADAYDMMNEARYEEQKAILDHLKEQSGVLRISGSNLASQYKSILDADFYGTKFSQNIWNSNGLQSQLQKDVFSSLSRIYTDMNGYKKERTYLYKKYNTSRNNAERLLKTEIGRIQSQTREAVYKENGFTHYVVVAEPKACSICSPYDGKEIKLSDREMGVNAPLFHPNCRCSDYGVVRLEDK